MGTGICVCACVCTLVHMSISTEHRFPRRLQVPLEGWLSAAQCGY